MAINYSLNISGTGSTYSKTNYNDWNRPLCYVWTVLTELVRGIDSKTFSPTVLHAAAPWLVYSLQS